MRSGERRLSLAQGSGKVFCMRIALAPTSIIAILFLGAPSSSAPPPPALVPEEYRRVVEGYDMAALYQVWRSWIESQKGAAIEALRAEPEPMAGEQAAGTPILRMVASNDFGRFFMSEVRLYCSPERLRRLDHSECHYIYRDARVPQPAAVFSGEGNPIAAWMRASFEPEILVRYLRNSGFAPDTDWWLERDRIFLGLRSPIPILRANATLARLDSNECPQLEAALLEMDRRQVIWPLDLGLVGEESENWTPGPHAVTRAYSFTIRLPRREGYANIEGRGPAFDEHYRPLQQAVRACFEADAPAPSPPPRDGRPRREQDDQITQSPS